MLVSLILTRCSILLALCQTELRLVNDCYRVKWHQVIVSEFDSHSVSHTSGIVPNWTKLSEWLLLSQVKSVSKFDSLWMLHTSGLVLNWANIWKRECVYLSNSSAMDRIRDNLTFLKQSIAGLNLRVFFFWLAYQS